MTKKNSTKIYNVGTLLENYFLTILFVSSKNDNTKRILSLSQISVKQGFFLFNSVIDCKKNSALKSVNRQHKINFKKFSVLAA